MARRRKPPRRPRRATKRPALKPRNPHAVKVRALVPRVKPSAKVYRRSKSDEAADDQDE